MSLDKRSIPISLVGGLSKGEDDFAAEGNARVRDGRFRLNGQIGKRSGSSDRRVTGLPALGSTDRNAIVELDGVPHVITGDGTYRRNIADGKWRAMNRGAPRPSRLTTSPLVRTNDNLTRPDCAVVGTLLCATWEDAETAQGFYAFYDVSEDTPRLISGPTPFSTIIDRIRVIAVGAVADIPDRFVVVGRIGSGTTADLWQTQYLISNGTYTFAAPTLIVIAATAFVTVEPTSNAKNYFVVANGSTGARFRRYEYDGTLLASTLMTTAANLPYAIVHNPTTARLVGISPNGNLTHIADDLSGVDATVVALTAPASGAPFTFGRAAICLADAIGGMWVGRSAVPVITGYSIGSPMCTQMVHLDAVYKVTGVSQVPGQFVLAGQAFYTAPTGPVFCVANQYATSTSLSGNGFTNAPVGFYVRPVLTDPPGTINLVTIGRFNQDAIYTYDVGAHLPHVCTDHATRSTTTSQRRAFMCSSVGANDGASFAGRKVDLVSVSLWYADAARNVTAQGLRLMGNGAGTTALDGAMVQDNTPDVAGYLTADGFDTTITQANNVYWPSGTTTSINLIIVWRWIDAKGNAHRSAPSAPFNLGTPVSGGAFNPLKVVFPSQRPTGLLGDQYTTPEVEVYMFPVGFAGAEYRLVGIVPPTDDPAEEARSFIVLMNGSLSAPVAALIRNRVEVTDGWWGTASVAGGNRPGLYTDTDELASWPSPPLLDLVSTQSRLWGLSAEGQRLDVWFTKPIAEGFAPEWSDTLRVVVPQEGGDIVALAGLDDKVVCLKRRRIFVITGDPGDATGFGGSMQPPRALASDVGCIDVNSVVEGPFGVAFLTERGFYTLSRSLELTFIGEPMIDGLAANWSLATYPQPVVIASDIVPSESEVRWSVEPYRGAASQIVVAWNYRLNKWAVQTSYDARSLCVADGVEWRLGYGSTADRALRQETPDIWSSGASDTQNVDSAWIKLNGIAGFQRLWRIVITLRWYTGDVWASTATDYKAPTEVTKTWTEATLNTLVDATTRRVQLVVQPTVQRCEALRLYVAGVPGAGNVGQGFELIGCQLDIGVKKGSNKKLPAAARG